MVLDEVVMEMEMAWEADEVEWELVLKMVEWDINPSLLISSEDQILRGIDCSY
jgi:hypothetical protein